MWMDLTESRTEDINLWVVASCRTPYMRSSVLLCAFVYCSVQFSYGKRGKCIFVRQPHHWVFCPRKIRCVIWI